MSRRRAVITGIGPITCIGTGVDHFWNGILAERSGIGSITSFDPSVFRVGCAGEISDWNPEEFFSPQRLKRLDRSSPSYLRSWRLMMRRSSTPVKSHKIASVLASAPRWAASARLKSSTSDT